MENTTNKSNRLEDQTFMSLSLLQIKEEADKVISDRKKNTMQIQWRLYNKHRDKKEHPAQ